MKSKPRDRAIKEEINNIHVSIIIPHYNSPLTLVRLLESIPKREDLEIIVVDDKSEERTDYLKIKQKEDFSHIFFLDNDTIVKSAGTCRNIGLRAATGKWVLFADADDFFLEGFYNVVSFYFNSLNDVVFFAPTSFNMQTGLPSTRHLSYARIVEDYTCNPTHKNELRLRCSFFVPWSKLIRRSFLQNNTIEFDEVLASNDVMFSTKVGISMNTFAVSLQSIYCVTQGQDTLTRRGDIKIFDIRTKVHIEYVRYLRNNLSKNDFYCLAPSGWTYIKRAWQDGFGAIRVLKTIFLFRRKGIPITRINHRKLLTKGVEAVRKIILCFSLDRKETKLNNETQITKERKNECQ